MSTVAFLNIAMHGHVNPTLPVVAELVRRGHFVTYHASPAFSEEIAATGATVHLYPGGEPQLPDPLGPLPLMADLAGTAVRLLPSVLADLRRTAPDLIVHDASCLWGAVAASELGLPAASSFTTFAFNRHLPSPMRGSWNLLRQTVTGPRHASQYVRSRGQLRRQFDTHGLPLLDLLNVRQPLNLVYTSRAFHPAVDTFDRSYCFVGPSLGARTPDSSFPADGLQDPVLYASLGTVFSSGPQLLRSFATALAPLGGTVVVATGQTDPAALDPLPANVLARRFVPQPEVLARASLFVTHGGMNSVNEALFAGVPMLVVPQGGDQSLVAGRVVELGAGLSIRTQEAAEVSVRALARRLLDEPPFRTAAGALQVAQRQAGGYRRAADELEGYLHRAGRAGRPAPADPPRQR